MTVIAGQEPWYTQTAQIIFYLTPAVVFILTGAVAGWRFNIFRTAKPSIKIDLDVTSRPSSDSWNVISAVASVSNTSRVIAKSDYLEWEVRVLAPFNDDDIDSKWADYESHMIDDWPGVDFPWNVQYRIRKDDPGINLEPGETNVIDMSLAIPAWITAIDVRCTLGLPRKSGSPIEVWTSRCPHDITQQVPDVG